MKALILTFLLAARPAAAEIPAWEALPVEPAARADALRAAVEELQAQAAEPLSAAGNCAAFSQLWLEKLNLERGYRLTYSETAGMGGVDLAGGGTVRRDKTHYFLADRTACGAAGPCGEEIVIDPTYLQFFEGGECLYEEAGCAPPEELRGLPRVLAGTREEIAAFYEKLAGRVRLYADGLDPQAGRYDAASAASLIYSFGANSGLRSNMEMPRRAAPAREGPRFERAADGVITDRRTGLQWLEGPDEPTSWEGAQRWIAGLGGGWRTPALDELEGLYLPDSERRGLYGDPLCLDPAFRRDAGYSLWSAERWDGTAWLYDFSRGYAHWIDIYFPGRFDRAVAVRENEEKK